MESYIVCLLNLIIKRSGFIFCIFVFILFFRYSILSYFTNVLTMIVENFFKKTYLLTQLVSEALIRTTFDMILPTMIVVFNYLIRLEVSIYHA